MGPKGSMLHSQGVSNNPYPDPNQPDSSLIPISLRFILTLPSHLRLCLSKGHYPVGLPVKILKAPLIDTYLFKIHSNIVLPPTPRPPQKFSFL